jgi:hypothetical protein
MEFILIIIMHVVDVLAFWKLLAWYIPVKTKTM